jgi:hypothetical protein
VDNLLFTQPLAPPSTLSVSLFGQQQQREKKYYHELKFINQDLANPLQINWRSFTSDLENDFTLSALPSRLKEKLVEKLNLTSTSSAASGSVDQASQAMGANENANPSIEGASFSSNCLNTTGLELSSSGSNLKKIFSSSKANLFKRNASTVNAENETGGRHSGPSTLPPLPQAHYFLFDWDDYFDKNHKISSNQNFRFSSLNDTATTTMTTTTTAATNEDSLAVSANNSCANTSKLAKRLSSKLNSYKDRFHPYGMMSEFSTTTTTANVTASASLPNLALYSWKSFDNPTLGIVNSSTNSIGNASVVANSGSHLLLNNSNGLSAATATAAATLFNTFSDAGEAAHREICLKNREILNENYIWDANVSATIKKRLYFKVGLIIYR